MFKIERKAPCKPSVHKLYRVNTTLNKAKGRCHSLTIVNKKT